MSADLTLRDLWRAGLAKVCNCAGCRRLLLGKIHHNERSRHWFEYLDLPDNVAGRIKDRPYCATCIVDDIPVARQIPVHATRLETLRGFQL